MYSSIFSGGEASVSRRLAIRGLIFAVCSFLPTVVNSQSQESQNTKPAHTHEVARPTDVLPIIAPNDNRNPAGRLVGKKRSVEIDARMGVWYPEGQKSLGLKVAAFAEAGKPLQNPGPLVRVKTGDSVSVLLRNTLAKPLTIRGLGAARGIMTDSVRIEPGNSHLFEFEASNAGVYYYTGSTGRSPVYSRGEEDSQLNGAIVVESPNEVKRADDRVFLISWWYTLNPRNVTGIEQVTMAINGQSWPNTERLEAMQGDSLRWRFINLTVLNHPMHLHGFYYRVDGVGNGANFTTYASQDRRNVVTELLVPGATMDFTWAPTRPGNWLLHCHVATHMSHLVSLRTDHSADTNTVLSHAGHDGEAHAMAGLVLGMHVTPKGKQPKPPKKYRALRLMIESRSNVFDSRDGYRYVLGDESPSEDQQKFGAPGPTLVLQQNEPVAVTIVNRANEPGAVHWHGIELESFPDGVPGFSGTDKETLPAIAVGDSLTVRFTPTRAGTFMYHSHFNEIGQISSGLHGAIVVVVPKEMGGLETDRVLLFSDDGPTMNQLTGPFPETRLNGKVHPDAIEFKAGVTYRLRFINIRSDYTLTVAMMNFALPMQWKPIAKDGADLPKSQSVMGIAKFTFGPGEIHDVEFTPKVSGNYLLQYTLSELPPPNRKSSVVPVIVK